MRITAIAAVAENGVIGSGEAMLWHLPEDWKRFKRVTSGHAYLEGRRTFEQLGLLPDRRIIVVTTNPQWTAEGVTVAHSIEEGLQIARDQGEERCYIGGGAQIYRQSMHLVTDLDITEVHQSPQGEARFPIIDPVVWRELSREFGEGFDFVHYARLRRLGPYTLLPLSPADEVKWLRWLPERPGGLDSAVRAWIDLGLGPWLVKQAGTAIGIAGLEPTNDADLWRPVQAGVDLPTARAVQQRGTELLAELRPTATVRDATAG